MSEQIPLEALPALPGKRYFSIGEASILCGVKAHVLRYWEQEFPPHCPTNPSGNRRYYPRNEVLKIREIKHLLYQQGYTIQGARQRLGDASTREDSARCRQIVKEVRTELAGILDLLKTSA